MDRIDIHLEVPRLKYEHLTDKRRGEPSEEIRKRVDKVREIQKCRYKNDGIIFNAHLESKELERYCVLDKEAGVTFWAYCLMKNHVHLIAVPKAKDSLANGIGETHRRYTRMVNFREDWRGFLWQGRFMSYPLDENYLYTAIRYVERNPVRAGLVKRAEDYQWSSAKDHVYGKSNILLSDFFMLSEIKDWRYYLAKENKDSDNKYLHI